MKICFIGGGNMATALIGGMLKRGYTPVQIRVVELNADNCRRLQKDFGVQADADLAAGVAGSEVIVLAVKPQQLGELATQLHPLLQGQLIISIAAGIRASDIARWLNTQSIVRVMPNTPALIQSGVAGLYALAEVNAAQRELAQAMMEAVGSTVWLKEEAMLDGVTAVSGSGPAYVFYFIEAMQEAAIELGFNEVDAKRLVVDTFLGAAKLADASPEDTAVLRARVTSKNGTTERALMSMELASVKQHIIAAVRAAALRSKEMGDELGGAN
ncbi:MAG: pyrroline-5-carboxylate reductase [Gallionellaceae bacterium]|nr:pyrroline-5-carboxylate reductase [Gallionellaceae bacterium]